MLNKQDLGEFLIPGAYESELGITLGELVAGDRVYGVICVSSGTCPNLGKYRICLTR